MTDISTIIIASVVVFVLLLLIIMSMQQKPENYKDKSKILPIPIKKKAPQIPVSNEVKVVPVPPITEAIRRSLELRAFRRRGHGINDNIFATQVLNTLHIANRLGGGAIIDRGLPVVIDIAMEIPHIPGIQLGVEENDRRLQFALIESAGHTRDKLIHQRREVAKTESTPAARVDKYVKLAENHSSDDQNSHDTYVNKCLKDIIANLREDQKELSLPSVFQIRQTIKMKYNIMISSDKDTDDKKDTGNTDEKANSVLSVIDKIYNEGNSKFNSSIGATEAEVLQRVWLRTLDPKNSEVSEQMQHMLYNSLESCWENNSIVCINGRCAKILSAIVALDHDTKNHQLETLELHKNKIFEETRELVKARANIAAKSSDQGVKDVALSYLAESADQIPKNIDPVKEKEFQQYLKGQIANMVKEKSVGLPPGIVDHIVKEAIAAV